MKIVKFGSTRLLQKNKVGILKPGEDGYYTMILGGLNAYNSVGEYYTLAGAEELFRSSSSLMRKLQNGVLKSELGHPTRPPGMSNDAWFQRVMTTDEKNEIAHIKELWLDPNFGKNNPEYKNPGLVAIMGKIRPSGPHGALLQASLDNPDENVTFSVRGLTDDKMVNGVCRRTLITIITFDKVTQNGINIATKWDSPALESANESIVDIAALRKLANAESDLCVATEHSRMAAREALAAIETAEAPKVPIYRRW